MRKKIVILLLILVGLSGILASYYYFGFDKLTDVFTVIFLYLSFVAIIWYSWETMDLKVETRILRKWAASDNSLLKKQGVTSVRPYMRLQKIEGIDDKLRLVNEGKGVAVNLLIKYKSDNKDIAESAVTAMAAAPSSFTDIHRNGVGLGLKNSSIEIYYRDIEDRKYIVIFTPNSAFNDGFEILRQEEDRALDK